MRSASTCSGPISMKRQRANGKPSCETSSRVRLDEDVARPRPPQAERRPGAREVGDHRAVGVVAEPLEVRHPVQAAGDHAEAVVGEPQDREVGPEAAARREQRRVDGAPDRHVHLAHGDPLDGVERAVAGDVEDAERRQVEHRRALAHGQVLGVDDRRPPARVPLGLAAVEPVLLDQRRVRLVPERPLPARRSRRTSRRAPPRGRGTAAAAPRGSTPTARRDARCRRSC